MYAGKATCQTIILYVWVDVASAVKDTRGIDRHRYTHEDRHADHFLVTGMRKCRECLRRKVSPCPLV